MRLKDLIGMALLYGVIIGLILSMVTDSNDMAKLLHAPMWTTFVCVKLTIIVFGLWAICYRAGYKEAANHYSAKYWITKGKTATNNLITALQDTPLTREEAVEEEFATLKRWRY